MYDYFYIGCTRILRFLLRFFPHRPFHKKRIVFTSYLGKQYSCNPKYICEYMLKHAPEYELVWAFQNPEQYQELENLGITIVKYNSPTFIRLCLSSGYIITNVRDLNHIPFTSRQHVINTWHGGGAYKTVGSSTASQTIAERLRQNIAHQTPLTFLSSSKAFTELTIQKSFHHNGAILECGMPRNDLLINGHRPDIRQKVFEYFQIPQDHHLLIYAPTYREDKTVADYSFETSAVKKVLSERFGGTWSILFRCHYYLVEEACALSSDYINASDYPDMQELLYASDILITDYSSSIWDFSFTKRPCLLYATDLDNYQISQGFYTDIHTWPFPLAESNQELLKNILNFDLDAYLHAISKHHQELGSFEHGTACYQILDYIRKTS